MLPDLNSEVAANGSSEDQCRAKGAQDCFSAVGGLSYPDVPLEVVYEIGCNVTLAPPSWR